MTLPDRVQFSLTQDEIDRLLAQCDGDGLEDPSYATAYCAAFDAWITDQATDGIVPERELDSFRADVWFMRGTLANASGAIGDALTFFEGSIERSANAGNVHRQILSLQAIARCYEYAGMQTESTRSIFEALDLAEKQGDDRTIGFVLHGLSALYEAQGAYEQLLESAHRTREIAERINEPHLLVRAYAAVGLSYGFLYRAEEGLVWMARALQLCTDADLQQTKSALNLNLIFLYYRGGRLDDAVALAADQLETIASLPVQHSAAIYVDVAEVNVAAGNLDVATDMLALADRAADDASMNAHVLRYCAVAADLCEARGDEAGALHMMQRYVRHVRAIRGREAQSRLVAVERRFATELASKTEEVHHLRTVELVEKNDQLSALIQQKDEILHVIAHDLRNPLAAAQLLSDSLVIQLEHVNDDDVTDQLRSIGEATAEMRTTLDKLLTLQRNDNEDTSSPVADAVTLAVQDARRAANDNNVVIELDLNQADLIVNSAVLRRSIDDLLQNAISSSESGGVIEVSVKPTESHGATVVISGNGVCFDQQRPGGNDLYIARRLVERMRGTITLSSSSDDTRQRATIDLRP